MRHVVWFVLMIMCAAVLAEDRVVWDNYDEKMSCDDPVPNILLTVKIQDSMDELREIAEGYEIDEAVDGFSVCDQPDPDATLVHCDVYIVRPEIVDGFNSWTLGHEALHALCGMEYHEA